MLADLHSHTLASDGALSPEDLVVLAEQQGVELLAITDHDCIDGFLAVCDRAPMALLSGVELSSLWSRQSVHIVGLGFDPEHPVMREGLARQSEARVRRAETIAERLAKRGFSGALEGARAIANGAQLGRPHFARFLVEQGHVANTQQAFKRYLGAGKIGDVKTDWPSMAEVVTWVREAGGLAVLAHPLHYKMTNTKLRALLTDFAAAGGEAMEVVSGQQSSDQSRYMAKLSRQLGLLASIGSDFHRTTPWSALGRFSPLPEACDALWESERFQQLYRVAPSAGVTAVDAL